MHQTSSREYATLGLWDFLLPGAHASIGFHAERFAGPPPLEGRFVQAEASGVWGGRPYSGEDFEISSNHPVRGKRSKWLKKFDKLAVL